MSAAASKRKIKTAGVVTIPDEVKALAKEFFQSNKEANEFSRKADAARKKLYAAMKNAKIGECEVEVKLDTQASRTRLKCEVSAPERQEVDVAILQSISTPKEFLDMVSASQKAVKDALGDAKLRRCLISKPGTENVTVKAV